MPDDTYKPHPEAELRRRSIARLIRHIVMVDDPLVLPEQKLQVIDTLLWKYTEADGKYNTPFRSLGAMKCSNRKLLRHEHVTTRAELKRRLLSAQPEEIESLLQLAVGCLVTVDEHKLLSDSARCDLSGWARYDHAGVKWVDVRDKMASTP